MKGFNVKRRFWSVYGRWAWDRNRPASSADLSDFLVQRVNRLSNSKEEWILDAGCGTGNFSLALAEDGFNVLGCDYAPGMLKQARKKIPRDGPISKRLRFETIDLAAPLPFKDQSFHHIICVSVLQALKNPAVTLHEFQRILKPGGKFLAVHFPRSPLQSLPLNEEVNQRLLKAGKTTGLTRLLWTAKCFMERKGYTSYWSPGEFTAMITDSGLCVLDVQHDSPLVVAAEK